MNCETTTLSFRDVLHARQRIGHIRFMFELAKQLGYPFFIWADRVYKIEIPSNSAEAGFSDSGFTIADVR